MVIDTLDDPAVLGNNICKLSVSLFGVGANTIMESRAVPKKIIKIIGRDVKVLCKLCGHIRLTAARAADDMNAWLQPGGQFIYRPPRI